MPVPPEGDKRSKKRVCERVKLSTGDVGVLLFADDMVIMAESKEGLQALSEAMDRWDLKWKTKVMKVAQKSGVSQVRIRHQVIEQVE